MRLLHKEVWFDPECPLYEEKVSGEVLDRDFEVKTGTWDYRDGWIRGRNPEEYPGMIISRQDFFGDVMVDFFAKVLEPSTHDINVMWNGCWDEEKNERGIAYVAGVQGWWEGKAGIEKSPEYLLNVGTPLFPFTPGKVYHIQAGSVKGHCFLRIDGQLIIEVTDPDPIDSSRFGKIGFEAYASWIAVQNIKVYRLFYKQVRQHYPREFA